MLRFAMFVVVVLCNCGVAVTQEGNPSAATPSGLKGRRGTYADLTRELDDYDEQRVTETDEPATLTLAQLKDEVEQRLDRIESMHVRFTSHNRVFLAAPGASRAENPPGEGPREFQYEIDFHMKGPKRFFANIGKNNVTVFDGEVTKELFGGSRSAAVELGRTEGFESDAMDYFVPISFPVAKRDSFMQSFYYLPTALGLSSEYRVLEKLAMVDGQPCHGVTSGYDTFWLDHAHGCALRRRVIFERAAASDPGHLTLLICCSQFRDLPSGHAMPLQCKWIHFAGQSYPASLRGAVKSIMTVSASEINVNETPDEQFEYEFPPGTLVGDVRLGKSYWMPKGIEMLDEAVKAGAEIVNNESTMPNPDLPSNLAARRGFHGRAVWLVAANAVMFALLIGGIAYRRRRGGMPRPIEKPPTQEE